MMAALDGQTAKLRPHTKVQKCPDIALLQVQAGAIGVTVATIWEAAAMAAAGVGSVLVANEVVGADEDQRSRRRSPARSTWRSRSTTRPISPTCRRR